MVRSRSHYLIRAALVASCLALLGTSAPDFAPEVSDRLEQQVVLDGQRPTATTTIQVSATASTLPAGSSHVSQVQIVAASGGTGDELGITVLGSLDGDEERGDEVVEMPLEDVCTPGEPCEAVLEVSVEWLNASPNRQATVTLTLDAGIGYTNGLIELGRAPSDAALRVSAVEELAARGDDASIRRQTEPESIELTAEAPFALRSGWVELDATVIDLPAGAELTADVIVTAEGTTPAPPRFRVLADRGDAEPGRVTPGEVMSIACPAHQVCRFTYTLVAEWDGRASDELAGLRWALAAVLRDAGEPGMPEEALSVGVDRVVSTAGAGRDHLTVTASGSVRRDPGDAPVEVPVEPGDAPHLIEAVLRTWTPVPGGEGVGVPTTGELRVTARRADDEPLTGIVRVGVVAPYPVTGDSYLRNRELTPAAPTLTVALKPSLSCYDTTYLDPAGPDGRCSVPIDVYVQPPDEPTGAVVVEWEITLRAVAPDGLELVEGDLDLETEGDR